MSSFHFSSIKEQVATHLREELVRGRWSGTMPGRIQLVEELGVSGQTVELALQKLEKEGLLVGQGPGRRRRIVLPKSGSDTPALRVALLHADASSRIWDFCIDLKHQLEMAGHAPFYPDKTLADLGADAKRVACYVKRTEADAWVIHDGPREVLQWFSEQPDPAFAFFGHRTDLPIAGVGPDKNPAFLAVTRRLLDLGHRRITLVLPKLLRLPMPGQTALTVLHELESVGIQAGPFNLPDWKEDKEGFQLLLESLFGLTPPTALILTNPNQFFAAQQFLAKRNIRIPQDVSLISADPHPAFAWFEPSVAHIHWDSSPVIRRIVRWVNNVARNKVDRRQTFTKAKFIEGGTVAPPSGNRSPSIKNDETPTHQNSIPPPSRLI